MLSFEHYSLKFLDKVPYSRKLLRGKTLCEFHGFVAIRESFLHEIGGHGVLWHSKTKHSVKVFSMKIVFFYQFAKVFSLESFLLYSITRRFLVHIKTYQATPEPSFPMHDTLYLKQSTVGSDLRD